VTKALLDTHLRDNLNELALHDHSGGSGSGTRALGGSATGLVSIYLRDGAAPGTPTGTISVVYTTGSRLAMLSSGGTAVLFATSGHEHAATLVSTAGFGTGTHNSAYSTSAEFQFGTAIPSASLTTLVSTALAIGGTGRRAIAWYASVVYLNTTGSFRSGTIQIERDGTSVFNGQGVELAASKTGFFGTMSLDTTLASGTYTYALRVRIVEDGSTVRPIAARVALHEVSVP